MGDFLRYIIPMMMVLAWGFLCGVWFGYGIRGAR